MSTSHEVVFLQQRYLDIAPTLAMVDLIIALSFALVGSFGSLVLVAITYGSLQQDKSVGLDTSAPDPVERTTINLSNLSVHPSSTIGVSAFNSPAEATGVSFSAPR